MTKSLDKEKPSVGKACLWGGDWGLKVKEDIQLIGGWDYQSFELLLCFGSGPCELVGLTDLLRVL